MISLRLEQGRHTGLPLQITTYSGAVGGNLRIRPGSMPLKDMQLNRRK
ncbi:MAG: hypothetical protein KAI83_01295 [Thiomargarita sp.]|nr:hypothetical protein [Thiomargarita sp.]